MLAVHFTEVLPPLRGQRAFPLAKKANASLPLRLCPLIKLSALIAPQRSTAPTAPSHRPPLCTAPRRAIWSCVAPPAQWNARGGLRRNGVARQVLRTASKCPASGLAGHQVCQLAGAKRLQHQSHEHQRWRQRCHQGRPAVGLYCGWQPKRAACPAVRLPALWLAVLVVMAGTAAGERAASCAPVDPAAAAAAPLSVPVGWRAPLLPKVGSCTHVRRPAGSVRRAHVWNKSACCSRGMQPRGGGKGLPACPMPSRPRAQAPPPRAPTITTSTRQPACPRSNSG